MNKKETYDVIRWSESPATSEEEQEIVTHEYDCKQWADWKVRGRIAYDWNNDREANMPIFSDGVEVCRGTVIVWSGCPCKQRHYSFTMVV